MNLSSFCTIVAVLVSAAVSATAAESITIDWSHLPDPAAQQFEDPYRNLTQSQFESLMALARLQIALGGELAEDERTDLKERASALSQNLQAQGLDPEWILGEREAVAERRQRAALSTNPKLEGKSIELTGYLLVASNMEDGETVAYMLPDRGVCMHLPPPAPNQLIKLVVDELPEPLGPCIAAVVRGRLSANESMVRVPVFDDTVPLWSSWTLDVSESITSGNFPAAESQSRQEVRPDRRP
jgi:hypothetical protein